VTSLVAPVVSITKTKRGRFFWAAWWTAPPSHVPFRKPDASDGAAPTHEAAIAAAEKRASRSLAEADALWARAWMRVLRGQDPWPSKKSREPRAPSSIWATLGVTSDVTEDELKAAYRKRVLETHPDRGGDAASFRKVVAAYAAARRGLKGKNKRRSGTSARSRGRSAGRSDT
jgi:hypothetical protein